jgi:hypothetical protein
MRASVRVNDWQTHAVHLTIEAFFEFRKRATCAIGNLRRRADPIEEGDPTALPEDPYSIQQERRAERKKRKCQIKAVST